MKIFFRITFSSPIYLVLLIAMNLSISYSSLSMFKRSPLEYFFAKIVKEPAEKINSSYGDAGTAVHSGLRAYIEKGNGEVEFERDLAKVEKRGVHGEAINFDKFRQCFEEGKKIVDAYKAQGYSLLTEQNISFTENIAGVPVKVTGYIDLILQKNNEVIILDWKTNSSLPEDGFVGQQEFYTYLYYKKHNVIPNTFVWVMLKNGNLVQRQFNIDTVHKIEKEIEDFVLYILERGEDQTKYDLGDYEHIFNEHFTSCRKESARRSSETILHATIYRNEIQFTDLTDLRLQKAIDLKFSYFPEGYEFSPKYQAGEWDGRIRLFKSGNKLPIGFYWMIQEFIDAYNKRFDLNYKFAFEDKRNEKVRNVKFETQYSEPPFQLYPYQNEAVYHALKKKIGIIFIGTSGGKSAIMAELCKRTNKRSLIIINRLELIEQTAEAFSEYLGVDVGVMHEGNLNINSQITVASVQTISAILKREDRTTKDLITYLYNVNAVMYDECQNVKDKSFYSMILHYAVNADYILGFSGSPFRNPKTETLSMNALVGDIIFTKTTGDLEKEGFIVPTKTYFIRPQNKDLGKTGGSYKEEYDEHVLNNEVRNNLIKNIVEQQRFTKKIIILTKYRAHNRLLAELIPDTKFIDSFTPRKERRQIFNDFKHTRDLVLISTTQIFSTGVNVPDCNIIINASASKSPITAVQSIGRVKRKSPGKEYGVFIDFFDADSDKMKSAAKARIKILEEYNNPCNIVYDTKSIPF